MDYRQEPGWLDRWDAAKTQQEPSSAHRHLHVLLRGSAVVLPRGGCQWRVNLTGEDSLLLAFKVTLLYLIQKCLLHREKCNENNVSTTKYPCVKSTGEVTTCYRYSRVTDVDGWCGNVKIVAATERGSTWCWAGHVSLIHSSKSVQIKLQYKRNLAQLCYYRMTHDSFETKIKRLLNIFGSCVTSMWFSHQKNQLWFIWVKSLLGWFMLRNI